MSAPPSRRFVVDPAEYPFADHWLVRNRVAMHFVDEGQGVPVLLLHGNPTWSFLYRDVIRALEGVCRRVAPDYPGFGFSDHPPGYGYTPREHAEWVGALIDHLRLEQIVLVVQDWGGPIGLSLAVERPQRIAGIVLLNTWCWPPDAGARFFSIVMGGPLGKYLHLRRNLFARRIVPSGIFHQERRMPAVLKAYTDPFPTPESRIGTWVFPRAIRASAEWLGSIERELGRLRDKPVEMVWAMRDLAFGKEKYIARWRRYFPDARLERLEDAAHYLQEDRPDRIAAAVRRLLERISGR